MVLPFQSLGIIVLVWQEDGYKCVCYFPTDGIVQQMPDYGAKELTNMYRM